MGTIIDFDGKVIEVYTREEVIELLTKLQKDIDEMPIPYTCNCEDDYTNALTDSWRAVENMIDMLKEDKDVKK